jgi:hypothetical protein
MEGATDMLNQISQMRDEISNVSNSGLLREIAELYFQTVKEFENAGFTRDEAVKLTAHMMLD